MNWHYDRYGLKKLCRKNKVELVEIKGEGRVLFVCAKELRPPLMERISRFLPKGVKAHFTVAPQTATALALKMALQGISYASLDLKGTVLLIRSREEIEDHHTLWREIRRIVDKEEFFTGYEMTCGKKTVTYDKRITKVIQKNTKRKTAITTDDIGDLHISLGLDRDVDDFIKEMFPNGTD